ncbi:cupredoxin domain-containing protein [Nocardioides baekrokdamisoli]|uniref:cupredoxin domain-containing protein n=1 Tax=Nocardioides baekrokdamisoli TaxID=1804624 RepID=UPI0013DDBE70|nr:plastocyanin/azurin family copper-binding protein [Nocardioides baekrokdamisoli]
MIPSTTALRPRTKAGILAASALTLALATACGTSGSSGAGNGATLDNATTVRTSLLSFMPATLTVKAGSTVTWTDTDSIAHTVTTGTFVVGSDGLRTSENPDGVINMPLSPGKNVTFTFTKPGKYVYYCSIHKGMSGEIVVTP